MELAARFPITCGCQKFVSGRPPQWQTSGKRATALAHQDRYCVPLSKLAADINLRATTTSFDSAGYRALWQGLCIPELCAAGVFLAGLKGKTRRHERQANGEPSLQGQK